MDGKEKWKRTMMERSLAADINAASDICPVTDVHLFGSSFTR